MTHPQYPNIHESLQIMNKVTCYCYIRKETPRATKRLIQMVVRVNRQLGVA